MSLQVWLPCNTTTLQTRGFFDVPTSNWTSGQYTITTGGVIGRCLKTGASANMNTTYTPDLNTSSFSFGGWFKFVKSEIEPKVIDKAWTSAYNSCTGNLIGNDSYGGLGLIWQTNNMYSSSNVFSYINVRAHLRTPTASNTTSAYQLSFDTWTHIFVVWNNSSRVLSLYINGELINSVTVAAYSDAVSRTIYINYGAIYSGNGFAVSLPCYIDDIRIYDDALSPLEIKELSQALVCHYKLDDPMIESTTNLVTTVCPSGGNQTWGGHTTTWTVYDNTLYSILPISKYIKADVTYSGSNAGGAYRDIQKVTVSPSTLYTYSAYIKTSDNFAYVPNANFLYRVEYPGTPASPGTKISEAGCYSTANRTYIGNGWYRCWGSFTTSSTTNMVYLYTYIYPNKNYTYMIGGWQLEQVDHMTPYVYGTRTSDLVCTDSSGYGNDMVFSSGDIKTVSDSARYNRSTDFTNTQYAIAKDEILTNSGYLPTDAITVNIWINMSSWGNPISCTEGGGWNIEQSNSKLQFPVYISGVGYKTALSGVLYSTLLNAWHMITGTCDKDNVKIYIDGELKGTTAKESTNPIAYASCCLVLAAEAAGTTPGNTKYTGKLSDVRIYGTALSADDILKLYNVGHKIANNSFGGIVKDELHTYKLLEMEDNATLNKVQLNRNGVARASGMSVNPNMLSSTPKSHNATEYCGYQLNQSEKFVADQTYTFQFWDVNVSHSGKTDDTLGISVFMGGGNKELKRLNGTSYFTNGHADYIVFSVTISSEYASHSDANNLWLNIYNSVRYVSGTMNLKIGRWKMEKGSEPTPWVPYSTDANYIGNGCGFIEDENNYEIKTRFYRDCITANRFKEF